MAVAFSTGTAYGATPATATANALQLSVAGSPAVDTAPVSASPADPNPSDLTTEGSPVLGVLSAGVLAEAADYDPSTGDSAACAGVVGDNGVISVGATGDCTVSGATSGVTITLGGVLGVGSDVITASAILESCAATATGVTATTTLIGVGGGTLNGTALTGAQTAPNSTILSTGLVNIYDNTQSTSGGVLTATALNATVLGSIGGTSLVSLALGQVTCGPFTAVAPTPAFPLKSLPIVGITLVALAAIGVPLYRRHARASSSASSA